MTKIKLYAAAIVAFALAVAGAFLSGMAQGTAKAGEVASRRQLKRIKEAREIEREVQEFDSARIRRELGDRMRH